MLAPNGAVSPVDRTACPAPDGKHGTRYYRHRHGCTCPDAYADQRRNQWGLRCDQPIPDLFRSSLGTQRVLQACAALGWGGGELAAQLGMSAQRVRQLRQGDYPTVRHETFHRLYAVAQRLHRDGPPADAPGSNRRHQRARDHARAQGWVTLDEWASLDELDDPHALPDSAYRLADAAPAAAATGRHRTLTDDQVDQIRDLFRRAAPYTFDRSAVAKTFGCSAQVVSDVIAARRLPGYTDLRRSCPDRFIRSRPPEKWTDVQIDAVRAAFTAGQAPLDIARAHGIHDVAVHRMIRGRIRPHRHLTDLTGGRPLTGRHAAASPADSDDRKETAA
ncbi:hypothetical protein [Microcystis phage Mwe-JY05]